MSTLVNNLTPAMTGFTATLFAAYFLASFLCAFYIMRTASGPWTYKCGKRSARRAERWFGWGAAPYKNEIGPTALNSPYAWYYNLDAPSCYPGDYVFGFVTFVIWICNSIAAIFLFMLNDTSVGANNLIWISMIAFHLIIPILYVIWAAVMFGARSLLGGVVLAVLNFVAAGVLLGLNGAYAAFTWDATIMPVNAWTAFGLYCLQVIWFAVLMVVCGVMYNLNDAGGEDYILTATDLEHKLVEKFQTDVHDVYHATIEHKASLGQRV